MKNFTLITLFIFFFSYSNPIKSYSKSFTFVLTHLENIKLKTNALFTAGDTKNWILDLRRGNKIYYTIRGRVGNNPLCGLTAKDNLGDVCAICITKLNGDNVEIELKYGAKTFRYYGYILR